MSRKSTRRDFISSAAAAGLTYSLGENILFPNRGAGQNPQADLVVMNGRIATQDKRRSFASAVAIKDGVFIATGSDKEVMAYRGPTTQVIDLSGRTAIPGLNDSHLHMIRAGLNYNMELRWEGVPSLADALQLLRRQAQRTPPPQWVRVVGGWNAFQFAERRLPTLAELNQVAPDTPVFVLHLYDRALLNRAALRALGYTKATPDPPGSKIQRDQQGNPTGLLLAQPNASLLYSALAKGPKLSYEEQINSTRQFMRELNRLGITSVNDAGGGYQNYPEDYAVIDALYQQDQLTVRVAYNLFTQHPKEELADYSRWVKTTKPGQGNDFYRLNGAGETLVYSAADFEDFVQPRPDLAPVMETELREVVKLLVQNRWPFRLHATYDESITRFLNIFEAVNREVPFDGLRWFFDHAETISPRNIERVRALNGGIAVQDRMAFQGEHFIARYGRKQASASPPIARMLSMDVPVGAGTDGTRVTSYNPWVSLYWLVTGKTVGGTALYPKANRLDRMEALRRYTLGSAWFSNEEARKGSIEVGKFADLAVLSADYFSIPEEQIKALESVLTIVDGKVVYGAGQFERLAPPPLPVSPDWSPLTLASSNSPAAASAAVKHHAHLHAHAGHQHTWVQGELGLWSLGCDCFAF